jgi:RNA polymerase sigma factor (TIGR02999 family)
MSQITQILSRIEGGDAAAAEQLLPLVYDELRALAKARMRAEAPGQTLQATALVHDAFLRLVEGPRAQRWDSRNHFFCAAAEAMRRILVEVARRKRRDKHGGGWNRHELDEVAISLDVPADHIHEALRRFALQEPAKAELVTLRYFAGFSLQEAAEILGISLATAKRYWAFARAWLLAELRDATDLPPPDEV